MSNLSKINTLIVDDHPLIIKSYILGLEAVGIANNIKFKISEALDGASAFNHIQKSSKGNCIDLAILDIRIPPDTSNKIYTGEELGSLLKEKFCDIKIIIVTSYNNPFVIDSIFKNVNPEGFLIKSELNNDEFIIAVKNVIDSKSYYSKSILNFLRNAVSNPFSLDSLDKQILYFLSEGIKTKDLCNYIPLSKPGIVKRKQKLRVKLGVETNDDLSLIMFAKQKGIV